MIKVTKLSKIYKSKNNLETKALDNVSFTLPDKGLIFVVGKSGSGKTTFLNLLGGLDNITCGNIEADGISFNEMTNAEYQRYRASYLGFIFQDFCLIDSLTIYENIKVAIDIVNEEGVSIINEVLSSVGLEEFKDRYPNQLSAGQKQRAAIARAIVKKPKLVLCDEPTGNLDSVTSKQILSLLKELSKNQLIIIVSHNMDDAYKYGDRIIELSDGRVISDVICNINGSINKDDKTLYLGNVNTLSDEELENINNSLRNGDFNAIKPSKSLMNSTDNQLPYDEQITKCNLKKTSYPFKKSKRLSLRLLKGKLLGSSIASFFAALVVVILSLCQMFSMFDSGDVVSSTLKSDDERALVMKKAYKDPNGTEEIQTNLLISLESADRDKIEQSNYQGQTYTLYNYTLPISFDSFAIQKENVISSTNNFLFFYARELYGVLITNEEFVKTILNIEDDIEYVAFANEQKQGGIYITDYVADSYLYFKKDDGLSYEDILGEYTNDSVYQKTKYGYINGIIKTDYKTKYKKLHDDLLTCIENPKHPGLVDILRSTDFMNFQEEARNFLAVGYTFNPNFISDSIDSSIRDFARFDYSKFYSPNFEDFTQELSNAYGWYDSSLSGYTLSMSYQYFGNLLKEELTYEQARIRLAELKLLNLGSVYVDKYLAYDYLANKDPVLTQNIDITIHKDTEKTFLLSPNLFKTFRKYDVHSYAFYFDDLNTAKYAYDALVDTPFVAENSNIQAAMGVSEIVEVFSDFYTFVSILLCLASLFLVISFSYNLVNSRKKEIGILKALGTSNLDLAKIFILQIIILGILTCLIFAGGLFILKGIANKILIDSFFAYLHNPAIKVIKILSFHPGLFILDLGLILITTIISTFVPLIMMRKIKPLQIIRSKE